MINIFSEFFNNNVCKECKMCCKFSEDDLWDLPQFTCDEKKRLSLKYPNIKYKLYNNMYIPVTIVCGQYYVCPFLDETIGCTIPNEKPIDCALWPFYIMRTEEDLVLAQDLNCPAIENCKLEQIKKCLDEVFLDILHIYMLNPEYIKKYRTNFCIWKKVGGRCTTYEGWNSI